MVGRELYCEVAISLGLDKWGLYALVEVQTDWPYPIYLLLRTVCSESAAICLEFRQV